MLSNAAPCWHTPVQPLFCSLLCFSRTPMQSALVSLIVILLQYEYIKIYMLHCLSYCHTSKEFIGSLCPLSPFVGDSCGTTTQASVTEANVTEANATVAPGADCGGVVPCSNCCTPVTASKYDQAHTLLLTAYGLNSTGQIGSDWFDGSHQ